MAVLLMPGEMPQELNVLMEGPQEARLKQIQSVVGGYLEAVSCPDGTTLMVDEDGQLKGLSVNELASRCANRVIVGPAVLFPAHELREWDA